MYEYDLCLKVWSGRLEVRYGCGVGVLLFVFRCCSPVPKEGALH